MRAARCDYGLLLLAALTSCEPAKASPEERVPRVPDDHGQCPALEAPILYESPRGSDGLDARVFSMRADGSGAKQIPVEGDFYGATWSPDGHRIAFLRGIVSNAEGQPAIEIGLMSGSGAELVTLVEERASKSPFVRNRPNGPSWSPDGRAIAFAARRDAEPATIWVVAASGGIPQRLMPDLEASHFDVNFSPQTSDEVVYVSEGDIWHFDRAAAVYENLTMGRVLAPESPRFSADAASLVFAGNSAVRDGHDHDLYVLDLATSTLTALTDDEFDDFDPVWSPDARSVLFARVSAAALGRDPAVLELWSVSVAEPSAPRQITRDVTANYASDWFAHSSCDDVLQAVHGVSP